jgi:hypothetical protein
LVDFIADDPVATAVNQLRALQWGRRGINPRLGQI